MAQTYSSIRRTDSYDRPQFQTQPPSFLSIRVIWRLAGAIKNVDHCTICSAFRFVLPLEVVMCRVREEVPACCGPWLLRARSARTGIAVAAFVIAMIPLRLVADERVDAAAVAAIIAEAEQSSEGHAAMRDDAIPRLPVPQSP